MKKRDWTDLMRFKGRGARRVECVLEGEVYRRAKKRLVDDGLSWQDLLSRAVMGYLECGREGREIGVSNG